MTTEFQPTLPPEEPFTDAELAFLDDSPPDLFPDNQNSNLGLIRRILSNFIQELIEQQATIWNEKFIQTASLFVDMHEIEYGLPVAPTGRELGQRRQDVLARKTRGPFTRSRRASVVEKYIVATFGEPVMLTFDGVALVPGGIPLHSEVAPVTFTYRIVENITGFSYTVRLLSTVTPDIAGLTRELNRLTPSGITFSIIQVPDPFMTDTPSGGISSLTVSGNEITDPVRVLLIQGDGRIPEESTGIWEGTTNRLTNGSFETNTTGWAGTAATLARITSDAKFGSACLEVTATGANAKATFANAVTGAPIVIDTYVASAWVKGVGATIGKSLRLQIDASGGAVAAAELNHVDVVLTGSWQRVSVFGFVDEIDRTGLSAFTVVATSAATEKYRVDAAQFEKTSVATPYVKTDGATAARGASRVQIDSSLLDPAKGWVAFRARMGWDHADHPHPGGYATFFNWYLNSSNYITLDYVSATDQWRFLRLGGGFGTAVVFPDPHVRDDLVTIVATWVDTTPPSTDIRISKNGVWHNNFSAAIPALGSVALADIGSGGTGFPNAEADSDIFWMAFGKGTLTDDDLATLNSIGNSEPIYHSLPDTAQITAVWPGIDATFRVPF